MDIKKISTALGIASPTTLISEYNAQKGMYDQAQEKNRLEQEASMAKQERDARAGLPSSVQEYEYAKSNGYNGSYNDYQNLDANRKAVIARAGASTSGGVQGMNPKQYDFILQERGNNLSIGQCQLISFIRAIVTKADVLILDEATSSIDPHTEELIQKAIERLIENRTSITIAHRLSTVQHSDYILYIEKGEVKEFGSLKELLAIPNG